MSAHARNDTTEWTDLLDRVEARLRRLELAAASPECRHEPGPDPTLEAIPLVAPTTFERVRLAAVLPAHRKAATRLADVRSAS